MRRRIRRSNAHFHDIECDEYCWKCNYDLDFPYGSCGCGNLYTGFPYILCSGSIDSIKKRPAANRGKRLPENRPDWAMIRRILGIGIPSGVENSMFQLGKLAIQSTVSTLGTTAIAAQAMTNILENLNGMAAIGIGVGLMTIVGQCMGADRKDEAVYYIKKLSVIAEVAIIVSCLLVFVLTGPVTVLGGMELQVQRCVSIW
mgnify:CR=1 FL=1